MACSSTMMVATTQAIFLVDRSLSAFTFSVGATLIYMLSIIHLRTGDLPWAILCSRVSFISFAASGYIFLNLRLKKMSVNTISSRFYNIWTAPSGQSLSPRCYIYHLDFWWTSLYTYNKEVIRTIKKRFVTIL